ncbi:hypothetical protein BR10RB9215_C10843 [Brucella sp. 10RB9215]|uniref:hypothetical protein n=1 Tax=Brucella sp. 10RB9215 TaxID=1149953 RepID=UPI00090CC6EA|nr:hypothetical protein [Brucella sp. 10RB9215]SBW14024.1 hypothetical protein BR10RB9215_C10843 [Brucella sp. 10RB9215]
MDPELANLAMQFLMRVPLKGAEVPAFNAVIAEVQKALILQNGNNFEKPEVSEKIESNSGL